MTEHDDVLVEDVDSSTKTQGRFTPLCSSGLSTILLIEDCENLSNSLARGLRMASYNVMSAFDGMEGLLRIHHVEPDLIVLDLGRPGLHGLKLLHSLRSTPPRFDAPVVALTGSTDPAIEEQALGMGAVRVLHKTTPMESIVDTIQEVLEE